MLFFIVFASALMKSCLFFFSWHLFLLLVSSFFLFFLAWSYVSLCFLLCVFLFFVSSPLVSAWTCFLSLHLSVLLSRLCPLLCVFLLCSFWLFVVHFLSQSLPPYSLPQSLPCSLFFPFPNFLQKFQIGVTLFFLLSLILFIPGVTLSAVSVSYFLFVHCFIFPSWVASWLLF